MNVRISLNFFGRTEEAINFYRKTIEAELIFLMRFHESPHQSNLSPELSQKIFHATFRVGNVEFISSDIGCEETPVDRQQKALAFEGFSIALMVEDNKKARQFFTALSDGGEVRIPLAKTFFTSQYGIVTDRFGITWKVVVESRDE